MRELFSGISGLLNDVFGDPVSYQPAGGAARVVQSVFRFEDALSSGPDGHDVLMLLPIWRVPKDLGITPAKGDLIQPGDGKTYEIVNQRPSVSPADDRFIICELEEVA
ncbi:hypothetical protein [Albirhodobacter sp. R86504]|uniref:head-tail joining protein n=1 Tax=Albirhodobacter sp. R86504 TaxID=3093848 RepID=UPI00366C5620